MKFPEASPVNGRPVRLEPCAPGASPRMSTAALGSPKPGNGLAPIFTVAVSAALLARNLLAIQRPGAGSACRR